MATAAMRWAPKAAPERPQLEAAALPLLAARAVRAQVQAAQVLAVQLERARAVQAARAPAVQLERARAVQAPAQVPAVQVQAVQPEARLVCLPEAPTAVRAIP